ncbi:hypothetical protein C8R45DRAFT_1078301 [Mycena sanguinolenta]|nr:hypothetical protein C8R45DRAFT_1078301 [Mycena sanguinolenta]
MPEIPEVNVFRFWLQRFINYVRTHLPPGDLRIQALYTDIKESDLPEMEARENRLLSYASTFNIKMLKDGYHKVWAMRLARLADAIPDTHGLLINKVVSLIWKKLPEIIRRQISPNYTCWNAFQSAIQCVQAGVTLNPENLPEPWYKRQTAGDLHFDLPSNSGLVAKMNCYMPPTWRGPRPDRRPPALIPPPPDKAWDHPIPCPPGINTVYPSPRSMHHAVHGDVFSPTAPPSLASSDAKLDAELAPAKKPKSKPKSKAGAVTTKPKPRARSRATKPKDRITTSNTVLTSYRFTVAKVTPSSPSTPSVAGISSHLAALGVPSTTQKKPERCTERDIDHSLYLFPSYLFPSLAEGGEVADCGMELRGIEHDPRSLILDLGSCFIEIEPLLHTSPQIFANADWDNVVRVPATGRGFKVVLAFQMGSYTVAFLSHDNLCYIYWYSRADIELVRAARVPDVVLEYWNWSAYVAQWLRQQDINSKWDKRPLSYVISMPGNHPFRGVGRYSSDEIAWKSGVPLYTLWGDVRKSPNKLCAVLESFFLFTFERYIDIRKNGTKDGFYSHSKGYKDGTQVNYWEVLRDRRRPDRLRQTNEKSPSVPRHLIPAPTIHPSIHVDPRLLARAQNPQMLTGKAENLAGVKTKRRRMKDQAWIEVACDEDSQA